MIDFAIAYRRGRLSSRPNVCTASRLPHSALTSIDGRPGSEAFESGAYPGAVTGVQVVSLVVGLALGALFIVIGALGLRGSLRRNKFVGVRSAAAMRSEEAFRLANRVSGLPLVVAGAVAAAGGLITTALGSTSFVLTVALVTLIGAVLIAVAAGGLGNRAAAALPEPESTKVGGGCTGCVCGSAGGCGAV